MQRGALRPFSSPNRPHRFLRTPRRSSGGSRAPSRKLPQPSRNWPAQKANFLASVLDGVGPQHGPHVTNALPGLSWHQWGEAVDCFWTEWLGRVVRQHEGRWHQRLPDLCELCQRHGAGCRQLLAQFQGLAASADAVRRLAHQCGPLAEIDAEMHNHFG